MPKGLRYVQWKVENADELAVFLEPFVCALRRIPGDGMVVNFPGGGSLQLSPGDCLVVFARTLKNPVDKLGVIHAKTTPAFRETEEPDPLNLEH